MNSKLTTLLFPILLFAGGFFVVGKVLFNRSHLSKIDVPITPTCPQGGEIALTDEIQKYIDRDLDKWAKTANLADGKAILTKIELAEKRVEKIEAIVNKSKMFNEHIRNFPKEMRGYFATRTERIKRDRNSYFRDVVIAAIPKCTGFRPPPAEPLKTEPAKE